MTGIWAAEILTDPDRGHQLYVELLEDGQYRGRLFFDDQGILKLKMYDNYPSEVPVEWLLSIVKRYTQEPVKPK